jgi:tetratricopeptide (TPR) repeat protein
VLGISGCATAPTPNRLPSRVIDPPAVLDPLILNNGNLLELPVTASAEFESDDKPLYHLIVAEFAGQRGLMDLAVEHYLETTKELRDLGIAKRATRIAVFARNNAAALEAAKIWVEQAPDDTEARQILAAMHIRNGDASAAINHLEYVLNAEDEGNNRQLRMIANRLSREEDKLTALAVMEQLISRHARDVDALVTYALLAIRAEELDKAAVAMERVSAVGARDTNLAMAYVVLLQKHEKSHTAFAWLERSIEKDADDYALRLIYARLLADSSRYEEARVQFTIVATKTPDNSDVLYALGLLNLQANRIDDAYKNFRELIKLEARSDDANFHLAQIAESREQAKNALELYRSVKHGANYFQAQIRIALILSAQEEVADAQAHLHSIVPRGEEQRLHLLRAEGEILAEHDRFDEAMAVYDRALADTYDMELLYTRAMLAEKLGRLDVLEADLQTIIEREPENSQALNALGYTLADHTDRYQEAYEFIERAHALSPDDFYILDSMGWALYRLGRLTEAVDFLNRARKIKDDPEVAAHLGEVLWVMGNKDAARDIWDSALRDKPDDRRLLDVIERLVP